MMLVTIGFVPNRGNTFSSPMTIFCEIFWFLFCFSSPSDILFSFQISTPLDSIFEIPLQNTMSNHLIRNAILNKNDQNCLFITGKRTDMVGGFVSIPSAYSPAGETNK